MNIIKERLLQNKNDLIEDTFCYTLFENGIFDSSLLKCLISDAKYYLNTNKTGIEITSLLSWIIECTNQCFISHHDRHDLFTIDNYSKQIELSWKDIWHPTITGLITV